MQGDGFCCRNIYFSTERSSDALLASGFVGCLRPNFLHGGMNILAFSSELTLPTDIFSLSLKSLWHPLLLTLLSDEVFCASLSMSLSAVQLLLGHLEDDRDSFFQLDFIPRVGILMPLDHQVSQ